MKPNEITAQIVHAAYRVHTQLGPGLLETVPEQRGDPVGSGKDFRAESAENAERAQGACGVGEAVDMAIPPKTARNHTGSSLFSVECRPQSGLFSSATWPNHSFRADFLRIAQPFMAGPSGQTSHTSPVRDDRAFVPDGT